MLKYLLCLLLLIASCGENKTQYPRAVENVDVSSKTEISCPAIDSSTAVLFTFGQSNSANTGEHIYENSDDRIVNVFEDKCYVAQDPLVGTTGFMGSVWVRTAQKILANGRYNKVIIIPNGVGGTSVRDWGVGYLKPRLIERLDMVERMGLEVTHFLWHQGEQDSQNMSGSDYVIYLNKVISYSLNKFPSSKFYVSKASLCIDKGVDIGIRSAQGVVLNGVNVVSGPDTDLLIPKNMRRDGCHMAFEGQEVFSELWKDIIL